VPEAPVANEALLQALAVMSDLYNRGLTAEAIIMLHDDLAEYPVEKVLEALRRCRRELKTFPSVAEIVDRLGTKDSPEVIAANIVQALTRYGDDKVGIARAKALVGPVGWGVVEREGGWTALMAKVQSDQLPTYRAQWTKLAKALIERWDTSFAGPALEAPNQEGLKKIGEMLKLPSIPAKGGTND
jgi:hypothetical protein